MISQTRPTNHKDWLTGSHEQRLNTGRLAWHLWNSKYLTPTRPLAYVSHGTLCTRVCICMRAKRVKGDEGRGQDYGLLRERSLSGSRPLGAAWRAEDNRDEWAKGYESSWANIELRDTVSPHESYTPRPKRSVGRSSKYTLAITILPSSAVTPLRLRRRVYGMPWYVPRFVTGDYLPVATRICMCQILVVRDTVYVCMDDGVGAKISVDFGKEDPGACFDNPVVDGPWDCQAGKTEEF